MILDVIPEKKPFTGVIYPIAINLIKENGELNNKLLGAPSPILNWIVNSTGHESLK